jgi:hypothetical protein
MQRTSLVPWVLFPLLLVSCARERPRDLRLERVFVADLSATSYYGATIARGLLPPLFLTVELSTTETFPLGARMVWGFCGGKTIPTDLVKATNPNTGVDAEPPTQDKPERKWYFAVVPITFKLVAPKSELPNYDIADDSRDICLTTGSGTYTDVWKSNEVRVPRSLIEKALHQPPRTNLPLSSNQLP